MNEGTHTRTLGNNELFTGEQLIIHLETEKL
jgi:hypothetical protein